MLLARVVPVREGALQRHESHDQLIALTPLSPNGKHLSIGSSALKFKNLPLLSPTCLTHNWLSHHVNRTLICAINTELHHRCRLCHVGDLEIFGVLYDLHGHMANAVFHLCEESALQPRHTHIAQEPIEVPRDTSENPVPAVIRDGRLKNAQTWALCGRVK